MYYYIESDGRVLLVDRKGVLCRDATPRLDEITAAEYVPLVEASALLCDDLMRQVVTTVANSALREDPR